MNKIDHRHGNIEQTDSDQRGERRVKWQEGFSGTTIKDTRTKSRGRVEAREGGGSGWGGLEGWGGNADNCN